MPNRDRPPFRPSLLLAVPALALVLLVLPAAVGEAHDTIKALYQGEDGQFLKLTRLDGAEVVWAGTSTAGRGLLTIAAPEVKKDVVVIEADGNNEGRLRIRDSAGKLRVELNVNDGDAGWMETFNRQDKSIVRITQHKDHDSGYISVRNGAGEAQAALYATPTAGKLWTNGNDVAEVFEFSEDLSARRGMVVCIDPDVPGALGACERRADPKIAGVISGAGGLEAGIVLGQRPGGEVDLPVALAGRAWVLADATCGAIEPGDLLVSSARAGYACAASEDDPSRGTVLGKAMSGLDRDDGLVLALIAPQ